MEQTIRNLELLRTQADALAYTSFPMTENGYPDAFSPEWTTWCQRLQTIIDANFKPNSAAVELVRQGFHAGADIIHNGPDKFEAAKSILLHAADTAINALKNDTFGEVRGEPAKGTARFSSKDIFVVHGHDHESKNELEIFLKELSLEPVVLHRQADAGRTIIEKFEQHSDVGYAVILLTPDDTTLKSATGSDTEERARQNVIFEWGFFVGRLGRDRVSCICKTGTTLPSDMAGLVYKGFQKHIDEVKYHLVKELKAAGYELTV